MNQSPPNLVRTVLTDPVHILAFGFGTGLSPVAPGTVGSLVGVAFAWLSRDLGLLPQLAIAAAIIVAGIWICGESARRIGVHPGVFKGRDVLQDLDQVRGSELASSAAGGHERGQPNPGHHFSSSDA